jgi:serine protease
MKKIVPMMMALLMVISVTVAFAGDATITKEKQVKKVDQQLFENKVADVSWDEEYAADEILVKFKSGVGKERIDKINSKHGVSGRHTSSYSGTRRLVLPKGKSVAEMVTLYQADDAVDYAEPNYIAHAVMVPNDPYYRYQWHLDNDVYGGIQMEDAWDIQTGAPSVIVAVIDTGVAYEDYREGWKRYYQAPDLAGTSFVAGYDFVNNDAHPNDDHAHGTHVTGTLAQTTTNNLGVAGVAFNARIMPVKVLDESGSGYYSWIENGIYYATDQGAQVISLSLGGGAHSESLENAVKYAYENGVTVIAAAGNDASSTISYPAAYDDSVIAVGATRYDETLAYYSNYGSSLDLVAPGGDLTMDQNGDGYGDGVLQNTFNPNTRRTNDFGYWFFQGTSMATPHVSGVAALLIANGNADADNDGKTTPDEVRAVLQETAEDNGNPGRDTTYGWGLVDAHAALQWTAMRNNPPVADANGPYSGDEGSPVTFDGSGASDPDGNALTYAWDFGDRTTGTGVNPTHTYRADGSYRVTLTVNDGKVDSDPDTTTATINDVDPLAAFSYSPSNPTAESPVQFTDESTTYDGITAWSWDFFGDETEDSAAQDPEHTYNSDGEYTVSLTIEEADGDKATATQIITVSALNQPPTANAGPDQIANEGDTVSFDGSGSSDEGTIDSYEWDFGDGTTGSGVTATHVYADDSEYTVILTVTDNNGATGTDVATVTINNVAPTAEAGGPYSGIVGQPITFTGRATDPGTADILTYSWDFGDDSPVATDQIVSHSYLEPKTYTATLTVSDDDGGVGRATATVTVEEAPAETVEFFDSFENGQWDGKWVEDRQNDWFTSTQRKTDDSYSAEVDGRATDATVTMIEPIDLSSKASATLTFSWFIEGNWDNGEYIKLDISDDGGDSWSEKASIDGTSRTYLGPEENHWIDETITLDTGYMVSRFTIRFRARVGSSGEDGNVDNVKLTSYVE